MTQSNDWQQPIWPQHPDDHYGHLANTLPRWLIDASPARRAALGATNPDIRPAFKRASPQQHRVLKELNAAYWTSQNTIERRLEHLQDARTFGEPLLRQALKQQYDLDLDVNSTCVRLYIPTSTPWFPIKTGASRSWTVSLLDAALHNFEPSEAEAGAYEADSTYITQPDAAGHFEILDPIKARLTTPAFVQLCRSLDIGGQYQIWLEDNLGVSNPLVRAVLQPQLKDCHKAALRLALELALIQPEPLSADAYRSILGIVDGIPGMRLEGKPLLCHDLDMMAAPLTGILLFAPDLELNRSPVRVVAYIPDDPRQPIKEYASSAQFMADLRQRLREADFQQFFSRFVAHADRGHFFADLNNRLSQITWHQHTPGDPLPTWRKTAAKHSNLQFTARPIRGDLWQHLHRRKLDKILNDARTLAVSTASADRQERWERWDSFTDIASTLLQIAAFVALPFVPLLGELMLAYTAYQLLDETFEGVVDWTEGLTRQAFEHAMGVVESLVQLGTFAAGGNIAVAELRHVMPRTWIDFIDRFTPTKTASSQTRYWTGDLAPYEQKMALPAHSRPNQLGLHAVGDKTLLPLENKLYAIKQDAHPGQFRIEHPTRPEAYRPRLKHNGNGTWYTELEQPLTWDRPTLLQRLGHAADSLSVSEREHVLNISGYDENTLRRMHVDHEPLPPLLADCLVRFKIDKDLQTFIDRIGSEHAETYLSADPQTQLQLLTEQFPWPDNKHLRLIDSRGEVVWQSHRGAHAGTRRHDIALNSRDVLRAALQSLDDAETKILFDEAFGAPALSLDARTSDLRSRLAQFTQNNRGTLFESRYRVLEARANPLAQHLIDAVPGLPTRVAEELLNSASGAELQQLEQGTVAAELKDRARLAQLHVRAVRARESLALASVSSPDTARLALHSLPRLPGWSGEVRIDINRYAFNGETLDSIGAPGARQRKVLVQLATGDYQAYDEFGEQLSGEEDFYNGLLRALPDSERKSMSLHPGEGTRLKRLIGEHALDHAEMQTVLSQHPLRKPHYDPKVMRLPGGVDTGYPRLHPGVPSLDSRVRNLYPSFSDAEITSFVQHLQGHPDGARVELSRLTIEYLRMTEELTAWTEAGPTHDPQTGLVLSPARREASRHNRQLLTEELQRCWRRQTALNDGDQDAGNRGYMFRFARPIMGDLPTLEADFSHVSFLILEGDEATTGAHQFLSRFTGVERMEIRNLRLNTLPANVSDLLNLKQLMLSNCNITLSADAQATLSASSRLNAIDLSKNPLGRVFSLEAMNELHYVDLADTGISSLPPGLLSRQHLNGVILSGNLLTKLPAELFDLPVSQTKGFDLGSNPYDVQTRNRVKAYFQAMDEDLGIYAPQADLERAANLYPVFDREMASDFVYGLPGTLEQGRVELTRLEAEYDTLTTALAIWTADLPAVHPVSGQPLTPQEELIEHSTRDDLKRMIEKGWRKETELDDFNETLEPSYELVLDYVVIGQLPTLSADFSHISHLYLHSMDGVTSVGDGFLRCFPRLEGLTIRDYRLSELPQSVFHMSALRSLVLPDCGITLTADTVEALAGMEHLDFLDLGGNPLMLAPDVSHMTDMATLILDHTQINELPPGLLNLNQLDIANLSDNLIVELPHAILEAPLSLAEKVNLRGNPLSEQSLQLLLAYFKDTNCDFGVEEIIELAEMEVSNSDDSTVED